MLEDSSYYYWSYMEKKFNYEERTKFMKLRLKRFVQATDQLEKLPSYVAAYTSKIGCAIFNVGKYSLDQDNKLLIELDFLDELVKAFYENLKFDLDYVITALRLKADRIGKVDSIHNFKMLEKASLDMLLGELDCDTIEDIGIKMYQSRNNSKN